MRPSRTGILIAVALGCAGLSIYDANRETRRSAVRAQQVQANQRLSLYASALEAVIEHYRALPAAVALDSDVQRALKGPFDTALTTQLDHKLERLNGAVTASTLTLLDSRGYAVAASNWQRPDSNVGNDYSFRPYFQQLAASDDARFFGVGITTRAPGYFLSKAVRDEHGALLGAVVIKLDLEGLERTWRDSPDIVLVTDRDGIAFLASDPSWRYYELRPLSDSERAVLTSTRKYAGQTLRPLAAHRVESFGGDGVLVQLGGHTSPPVYLWSTLELPSESWTLNLLSDVGAATRAGHAAALIAAGASLTLVFLSLFLQQRWRLARLRKRSREELEQLVQQHTADLRNAQDSLVQAASLASNGRDSLEHLPQGVSVVDSELRLTAWNRRYLELLKLPPNLVVSGRSIEDILRYNAARGLLRHDDVEGAIRRRLDHLRTGKPYVLEREWPDGTVIEIRGNPLPQGGFVTSYTDITSYKSTARELRTLATTLEQRVEQRTRELQEAKHEAERANRSKTRYVAAAVHDLQQPLNAARMFVSVLNERLRKSSRDQGCVKLADSVAEALAAEEAILSSLFDIARLESGAIETHVRDLPLNPLLETLGREFGILAQPRGLTLRCVSTRAIVRSDEAMLRRILQNFLANAIRYTRRGTVLLGCRRHGASVRIEVWDTGPGIPEHEHQAIFEEFRRLDTGEPTPEHGAGLGLAVVDRAARLLGHPIGLRSWLGRGSVFSVTVPLGDPEGVAETNSTAVTDDHPDGGIRGRRIWCIDDDPRVREGARVLLETWGCSVEVAAGSVDARVLASRSPEPELLLLDYHLAGQTGVALFGELCAIWRSPPPVILITSERDAALVQQAKDQGWGVLHKPLRPPALRALMSQLLARAS